MVVASGCAVCEEVEEVDTCEVVGIAREDASGWVVRKAKGESSVESGSASMRLVVGEGEGRRCRS